MMRIPAACAIVAAFIASGCGASSGILGLGGGGGGATPANQVTVGNFFFQSTHNSSSDPAVDTVSVGSTVTWSWGETGTQHSVQSTGAPSFASSSLISTSGTVYTVTFSTAGTYNYDCSVHTTAMTGSILVK